MVLRGRSDRLGHRGHKVTLEDPDPWGQTEFRGRRDLSASKGRQDSAGLRELKGSKDPMALREYRAIPEYPTFES